MPRLFALQFDLQAPPPRSSLVIVWPDDPGGNARPVIRDQHWLDVRTGDELYVGGKRRTVTAVRVYRGDGAGSWSPVVDCGRAWAE
jgi:hypothetical protein